MLTANICLYMASLRPFSKCWPQKMTPMTAECGYNCASYRIGFLETNSIGMNMTKQLVLPQIYIFIFLILTPKTIDKWPHRDHFQMLDLEKG